MTENQRVREIRRENKLTMAEFGDRLGVTKSAISRIESGGCAVSLTIRRFISREFHVREGWLETGCGEKYIQRDAEGEVKEAIEKFLEGEAPEMKIRLAKILSTVTDDQLWFLEAKLWEILTGEYLTMDEVKARVLTGKRPTPLEPKAPHDLTEEEAHAALAAEFALRKKDGSLDSGGGSSSTATA